MGARNYQAITEQQEKASYASDDTSMAFWILCIFKSQRKLCTGEKARTQTNITGMIPIPVNRGSFDIMLDMQCCEFQRVFQTALPALSPHPADSRLRGGVTAPAAAPAELPVVAFPRAREQEAPAVLSREQLPDLSSSRDFTQYLHLILKQSLEKSFLVFVNS
ncbi:hypothetical protein E5288_WYG007826 [Bos mutus]|uniref:Uncharacterized protein n=1 Tax=Bos mutus TaxID=72004 RepID=A0A6B0RP12_9CETA|nr:hypothetical protein [Bos mutus]